MARKDGLPHASGHVHEEQHCRESLHLEDNMVANGNRVARTPYDALFGVRRELDRMFEEATGGVESWTAPAEVVETQNEIRFAIEVPGLRPEDIDLTIENGVLTVSGEKRLERREGESDDQYRLFERRYGRFSRSFRLPPVFAADRVNAVCEHGVLTITLPRAEEARPRKIEVRSGIAQSNSADNSNS
jgi:HSP20 family protein